MSVPYDFYDYPSYWQGREYEDEADKLAIAKLLTKIEKKGNLIDIGGGYGRLSSFLAADFKEILLVDQSKGLLKEAEKQLASFKNIKVKKGDCENLPVKEGTFDVALMVRIAHHLEKPEKAFREVYKALKPGGFFILEFANKLHFLACIKAILCGDFGFRQNLSPLEKRSKKAIKEKMIIFCNHHPQAIQKALEKQGFKVVDKLSVSNFRFPILKKVIPLHLLLSLESAFQKPGAKICFGPSIFLLAKKI